MTLYFDDFDGYEPSDSVVVISQNDAVQWLPVVLKESAPFVHFGGTYIQPRTLRGFLRFEKVPSARPRPAPLPLPIHADETRAAEVGSQQSVLERLVAAQKKWAEEKMHA